MRILCLVLAVSFVCGAALPVQPRQLDANPDRIKPSPVPRHGRRPAPKPARRPTLAIQTTPERCSVKLTKLDNRRHTAPIDVTTDERGFASVGPVQPGTYSVRISREGYEEVARMIDLHPAEDRHEHFLLEPRFVELLVSASARSGSAADSGPVEIVIDGFGTFTNLAKVKAKPGTSITIAMSKAGYESVTRTVVPVVGRDLTVSVDLRPREVNDQMPLAESAYRRGEFDQAAALTSELLIVRPGSVRAHAMLGLSYYRLGRLADSAEHLAAAVRKGRVLLIPVRHLHPDAHGREVNRCNGYFLVSESGLLFVSTTQVGHDFQKPISLRDMRVGHVPAGPEHLTMSVDVAERVQIGAAGISGTEVTTGDDLTVLKVVDDAASRKRSKAKRPSKEDFVFEPAPATTGLAGCARCPSTLDLLYEIVQRLSQK